MSLDRKTNEMRAAVEEVFKRLPEHYRTEVIKAEIAKAVAESRERGPKGYEAAARAAVYAMFATFDQAIANRSKLASFIK